MKETFAGNGSGSKTRKGVKANHPGSKLVNITNGLEIRRVRRDIASHMVVPSGEWRYCPKKFKLDVL